MNKLNFLGEDCHVELNRYQNGRLAICLVISKDGEPMTTATVNLPEIPLLDGFVFIKNYSENEGILDLFLKAGIVDEVMGHVPMGFVIIPICSINKEILETYTMKDELGFSIYQLN